MKGWSVTIEGRPAKAVDPEAVLEQLTEHHAVVSYEEGLLSTTATIDARGPMEAYDFLYEALGDAVGGRIDIELVTAETEARQEQDLARPDPRDVVGIAEFAELVGVSRQRAFQMTANRGFPSPVLELASGRLWSRDAIQRYLADRKPRAAVAPQTGARLTLRRK